MAKRSLSGLIFVKTCDDGEGQESGLFEVGVHPLQIFGEQDLPTLPDPVRIPEKLDVYAVADPHVVDILQLVAGRDNILNRSCWHEWSATDSDIDGCIQLHRPSEIASKV